MNRTLLILCAFCASVVNSSTANSAEVDVFLFGGQSNMQGIGKIANLPKEVPLVIPNAFYYFDGKFQPIVLGKTRTSKRAG